MPDTPLKKRITDWLSVLIVPTIGRAAIRFIYLTMEKTYVGDEPYKKLIASGEGHIITLWHGRLMMIPYGYQGKNRLTALISQHKDGELIARTLKGFGVKSVRGSSTRGWFGGVKGLLKAAAAGRDLFITPDGPQGPRFKAQMGTVTIAAHTGLPIIPMAFSSSKKKLLGRGTALSYLCPLAKASLSTANP